MADDGLLRMVGVLAAWRARYRGRAQGRCLEAVRFAAGRCGLSMPGVRRRPHNTALGCLEVLEADPERYGWVRWRHDEHAGESLPLSLVFFADCGRLKDGRIAGHVGVFVPTRQTIEGNSVEVMSEWWADRLRAAYVPLDGWIV